MNSDKIRFFNFQHQIYGHGIMGVHSHTETIEPTRWRKLMGDKPVVREYYSVVGFATPKPEVGDLLLVTSNKTLLAMFRVNKLRYIHNPRDMFEATDMTFEGHVGEGDDSQELLDFIASGKFSSGENDHLMFRG